MWEWNLHVSPRWLRHFFLVNWVQIDLRQARALISTYCIVIIQTSNVWRWSNDITNECLCLRCGRSSSRFTRKKCLRQSGETCRLHSFLFGYVVFWQPLSYKTTLIKSTKRFFVQNLSKSSLCEGRFRPKKSISLIIYELFELKLKRKVVLQG